MRETYVGVYAQNDRCIAAIQALLQPSFIQRQSTLQYLSIRYVHEYRMAFLVPAAVSRRLYRVVAKPWQSLLLPIPSAFLFRLPENTPCIVFHQFSERRYESRKGELS